MFNGATNQMDNANSGPNIKDCTECNNPRECHNSEQGCPNPQHGQYHVAYAHARRYQEAHPDAVFTFQEMKHLMKNA